MEDGSTWEGYQSHSNNMLLGVDYGITDRLAVDFSLPFIATKYTGKDEPLNLPRNVLDDGSYHGTFQDFQFGLRYNLPRMPFAVTPFFTVIVPSHDYDPIGEAAAGAHLNQFVCGVYAGRLLNPALPRTFVQGMYSYAVVEKVIGISLNRSNAELVVGQFITPKFSVNFLWRGQWMHGGLNFSDFLVASDEINQASDRITRQNFQHIGGSAGFTITESLSASFSFIKFIAGENAHMGEAVFAGMSWSFKTRSKAQ
jgi:hypothetical protein